MIPTNHHPRHSHSRPRTAAALQTSLPTPTALSSCSSSPSRCIRQSQTESKRSIINATRNPGDSDGDPAVVVVSDSRRSLPSKDPDPDPGPPPVAAATLDSNTATTYANAGSPAQTQAQQARAPVPPTRLPPRQHLSPEGSRDRAAAPAAAPAMRTAATATRLREGEDNNSSGSDYDPQGFASLPRIIAGATCLSYSGSDSQQRPEQQESSSSAAAAAASVSADGSSSSASSSSSLSPSSSSSSPSPFQIHGAAMVVTDDSARGASSLASSSSPTFAWQRLSLDRAVAPLLREPVAPFVSRNHERKRALLNATYYSECFLRSIGPMDADTAALDAQSRYEKWWVGAKFRGGKGGSGTEEGDDPASSRDGGSTGNKRRRVMSVQPTSDGGPADRSRTLPVSIVPVRPSPSFSEERFATSGSVEVLKAALVEDLRQTGGDVSSPAFVACLDRLHALYRSSGADERRGGGGTASPCSSSASAAPSPSDGTWIALSKPTFTECRGRNGSGQYLYTLGRLSFDMFRPTSLLCSLRGVFNTVALPDEARTSESGSIHESATSSSSSDEDAREGSGGRSRLDDDVCKEARAVGTEIGAAASSTAMFRRPRTCPSRMLRALQERHGRPGAPVRNYDIVVAFTIEPHQTRRGEFSADPAASSGTPGSSASPSPSQSAEDLPSTSYRVRRPIRGLLTNHGYMIPDPTVPNRLSIWFSGGTLECHQDEDLEEWRELFHHGDLPRRDLGELARVLAAKVLLGATSVEGMADDGSMSYQLRRPIGGHGQVFCDVLYGDHDLRVLRGHHGTVYVHRRVPSTEEETRGNATV